MNRWTVLLAALLMATFIAMGCSSGGGTPTAPTAGPDLTGSSSHVGQAQTHLWGYYDVYVDVENQTVEAVLNRMCMFTANVTTFVNNPVSNLSFHIYGTPVTADYVDVDIDVTIKHPFPGMNQYDGYDVKGVFMGTGSATMEYSSKLKYAEYGTDQALYDFNDKDTLAYADPYGDELVGMPDGYTRWFNAKEFTFPGIMGYTPGKLATPGYQSMLTATLNPYKYFADGMGADEDLWTWLNANAATNGVFSAGTSNTRNYYLRFPTSGGVKYGYAVVASWKGEAPEDHPANAPEAAACMIDITPAVYYVDDTDRGGDLILDISLWGWDYQPTLIKIESTVLSAVHEFDAAEMTPTGGDANYSTYHCEINADAVSGTEGNEFWVIAEYGDFDYSSDFTPPGGAPAATLAAFFRNDLYVSPEAYNKPPTITSGVDGEVKPIEWTTEIYTVVASDPDGDVLSYSWVVTEDDGTVVPGYGGVAGNGDGTIDIDWGDIAGWTQGPIPYIIYCEVSDGIAPPVEATPLDVEVWVVGDKWVSNHTDFASTPDNGTLTEPYSNINQALSGHASGVKIIVDKGSATYTDVINQSSQPGFTLRSWCFHTTPVGRATISNTNSQGFYLNYTNDVTVQGFKIAFPTSSYQYYFFYTYYSNNLKIIDNWFTGTTLSYQIMGIYSNYGNSMTVKNNLYSDVNSTNTWNSFYFIYNYAYGASGAYDISQNEITNIQPNQNNTMNYVQGIFAYYPPSGSKYCNNLIHHVSPNCGSYYETYMYLLQIYYPMTTTSVANNVIDKCDGDHAWNYWYTSIYGLYCYNGGSSSYQYDAHSNIITNLTGTYTMPYYYGTYMYNVGVTYTDVWNIQDSAHGWTGPGVGCITQDPKFVNNTTAPYDYHLDTGSPCIDTGKNGEDMGCYGNLAAGEVVGLLTPKGS